MKVFLPFILSLIFISQVNAAPINYIESGNEFEESYSGFDGANSIFTLDVGLNSISGSQQFEDSLSDVFGFIVQEGQILTSATFNVLTFNGYEGNSAGASIGSDPNVWGNYLGSSDSLGAGESSSFSLFSWSYLDLPLAAGDYAAFCCGGGYRGTDHGYDLPQFTYRFDFVVEEAPIVIQEPTSVPEPASIALLGLGLAGLGFSRRTKA